ncbi:MAG TPA: hypothetical protein VGD80_34680 [Kofleriaceae bacterium]
MTRLHARTNSEAHLYMDLNPCGCGGIDFERHSAVITEGDALCSRYSGACKSCGARREFVFELPETFRPIRGDHIEFGGDDPSRLLDPGEWLAVAEFHARRNPGTRDDLDIARAAVEEVLKFAPAGAERVPDDAFRSERGRAVRDREPGRFRRARLEAVLGAYRDLLAKMPAPMPRQNGRHAEPAAPPARNGKLDESPLQALIEALASMVARAHGFEGPELQRHVSDFKGQVQSLVKMFDIKAREEQQRRHTTSEVERLLEGIARTGTAAGQTVAQHREQIAQAFRGVDLSRIADGLQVLAQWLRNPTDDNRAPVQQMIADLQATMDSVAGSPAPIDEERRAQIQNEVRASLEQMFRGSKTDN